jgi:hypothetical protein
MGNRYKTVTFHRTGQIYQNTLSPGMMHPVCPLTRPLDSTTVHLIRRRRMSGSWGFASRPGHTQDLGVVPLPVDNLWITCAQVKDTQLRERPLS